MTAAGDRPRTARPGPGGRVRAGWAALTGTGAAASAALALLVLAGVFIAVAVPRASLGYRTQVLQRTFAGMSSSATTVLADADISGLRRSYLSAPQLTAARGELAAGLRRAGLPLAPGQDWSGMATGSSRFSVAGQPPVRSLAPPQVELIYRSGLPSNGRLAAGRWPAGVLTQGASRTFQIAVTTATAARFHLHPGSRMRAAGQVLVVTGIIAPRHAGSSFWTVDPVAAAPRLTYPSPNSAPYLSSGAFVGPAELSGMQGFLAEQPVQTLWSFPLDLSHVTADQAAGVLNAVQRLSYLPAATSVDTSLSATSGESATIQTTLSSGLATHPARLRGHRRRGAAGAVAAVRQPGRDRRGRGAARSPAGCRAPAWRVHHDAGAWRLAAPDRPGRAGWRGGGRGACRSRRGRCRRGRHPGTRLRAVLVAGGRDHRAGAGGPAAAGGLAAAHPPPRRAAAHRGRPAPGGSGPPVGRGHRAGLRGHRRPDRAAAAGPAAPGPARPLHQRGTGAGRGADRAAGRAGGPAAAAPARPAGRPPPRRGPGRRLRGGARRPRPACCRCSRSSSRSPWSRSPGWPAAA